MTTTPILPAAGAARSVEPARRAPTVAPSSTRASFRQPVSTSGYVDGAWWPRTTDLAAELPALLEMLWTAARDIVRISYHLGSWAPAPTKMRLEDRLVRLGGYNTSEPGTVRLSDAWGRERIDLLVIAPDTEPVVARRAMQLASRPDSAETATELMALARCNTDDTTNRH